MSFVATGLSTSALRYSLASVSRPRPPSHCLNTTSPFFAHPLCLQVVSRYFQNKRDRVVMIPVFDIANHW